MEDIVGSNWGKNNTSWSVLNFSQIVWMWKRLEIVLEELVVDLGGNGWRVLARSFGVGPQTV